MCEKNESIDESLYYHDWLHVPSKGFPPAVWPASGKKSTAALDAMRKGGPARARQIRKTQTCAEATWNHTRKSQTLLETDKSTNHEKSSLQIKTIAIARRDAITTGDLPACWPRGGLGMSWIRLSFCLEMFMTIDFLNIVN